MASTSAENELRERVKELMCLYDVTSAILQHSDSIDTTLTKICDSVKLAYQYPDDVVIELFLEAHYVLTGLLPETTVFQVSPIMVFDSEMGYIKVHYNKERYTDTHFLPEEQKLLNKVAIEVSSFFEKLILVEKEKQFQRTIAHADRLSILGEITAGIAHELNTPLGNILGYAELIREAGSNKQVINDLSKIIKAAVYSREIVKKLMFFSCEMPQHPEQLDLGKAINESLALLSPNFNKKNIRCRFENEGTGIITKFDSTQLTQVLFNVLLNAIYASPYGSEIIVRLYIALNDVIIEVEDRGEGIPDAVKTKIFEPFFTTKPVGEGTGLGLSVVHGILKGHGGDIDVQDNFPTGTIFKISLPIKKG